MANRIVFAAGAHPDDIEFMMAGTLILLKRAGFEVHYMNVANGSCGTATHSKEDIIRIRTQESKNAAALIGAVFHPPIVDDIEILYDLGQLRKVSAVVREVAPDILLLQSPQDYMEDHQNSVRLMVSAAFCRGMRNFATDPPRPTIDKPMAVYHALPYGLCDQLGQPISAQFYINIGQALDEKRRMLACHKSQKEWLDHSQGLDSYLHTMAEMCREVGRMSGQCEFAEGWRRHSHLGFGDKDFDALRETLGGCVV